MGASDPLPTARPEIPPPPPGPFDSGATGASLGVWLYPEMMRMLALPHPLPAEHGEGLAPFLPISSTQELGLSPLSSVPALLTRSRVLTTFP